MALINDGYWPDTYWVSRYWQEDYWPEHGSAAAPAVTPTEGTYGTIPEPPLPLTVFRLTRDWLEQKLD